MQRPWKQDVTLDPAVNTTKTTRVQLTKVVLRGILFPAVWTGAGNVSFECVPLASDAGDIGTDAPAIGATTWKQLVDSTGALLTVNVTTDKLVALSQAQREALQACMGWVHLVASVVQAGGSRLITLVGECEGM